LIEQCTMIDYSATITSLQIFGKIILLLLLDLVLVSNINKTIIYIMKHSR